MMSFIYGSRLFRVTLYAILSILWCTLISCRLVGIDEPPDDTSFVYSHTLAPTYYINHTVIHQSYLYASDGLDSVSIYNIQNWAHQPKLSTTAIPTNNNPIRKIEIDYRENLYIAAGHGGLHIVNTINKIYPVIHYSDSRIYALDVSYEEDYLAVVTDRGWRIYYLFSLSNPIEVGNYEYFGDTQPQALLLRGHTLYVFNTRSIEVFDISNFNNITIKVSIPLSASFVEYEIMENYLAVATRDGLHFVDYSIPFSTSIVYSHGFNVAPRAISYTGGMLYIAYEDRNLDVYKVFSIYSLSWVSRKLFYSHVTDVDFDSGLTYISNREAGIQVYSMVF